MHMMTVVWGSGNPRRIFPDSETTDTALPVSPTELTYVDQIIEESRSGFTCTDECLAQMEAQRRWRRLFPYAESLFGTVLGNAKERNL